MDERTLAGTVVMAHPGSMDPGSTRIALEAIGGLTDHGWHVLFVVPAICPLSDGAVQLGAATLVLESPVLSEGRPRALSFPAAFISGLLGLVHVLSALRSARPDAVLVVTARIPLWVVLARMLRLPVLLHLTDEKQIRPRAIRGLVATQLMLATQTLVGSAQSMNTIVATIPQLAGRVSVLPNSIDAPLDVAAPRDRIDGAFRLVCAAHQRFGGGADIAIEALGVLTGEGIDAHLELVGDPSLADPAFRLSLLQRIDVLGLRHRVEVCDAGLGVWSAVAAADMVLVLSRWGDPFGDTAVRAVLAGRPVAVSTADGLADTVDGFVSAIPITADPADLAIAIRRVRSSWSAFRTAAAAMAPIAAQLHSPSRFRVAVDHEIRHLVARSPVRA